MPKNLVIVESPAKAGTIEGYLGKEYTVASSYGHVRDLPKGDKAIDKENGFEPKYEISKDKKEVIKNLKKLAKESETVFLASDDDREGEAIAWHLSEALKLNEESTKRIVFREITKNAVLNALESPRKIDMELVNAQQARRILDRLVGFELSPILWRKIKTGLSAGRVQSVAVRLVVEQEREIEKFKPESSFKVTANFTLETGEKLKAELPKKFATSEDAHAFLSQCIGAEYAIANLESKPTKKSPAAPFTTSTLQQEASRKLGYSVAQTMRVAQQLYEKGLITYMRTDSTNLSGEAISGATREIEASYGEEFIKVRKFKTKSASAQEAHEAIRPTNFSKHSAGDDAPTQRIYKLIWKRAIASQMADAQLEKTTATISISTTPEQLISTGEVVKFEGFLKVYVEGTDEENGNGNHDMLPPLNVGQELNLLKMVGRETFTRHPARYSEASLVKKLEELGIGRPSTFAPTISTILKRNYVVKESREGKERNYRVCSLENNEVSKEIKSEITGYEKKKLFPTDIGMIVNDFLVEHFPNIVDNSFTACVEEEFDKIANGKHDWVKMIDDFYQPFHEKVKKTAEAERPQGKELGVDPETGKKVYARLGRFGPIVQIGESTNGDPDAEKPKYASLRNGQLLETISLEEALELFKLPREVGSFEDELITVAIGRFGPYVKHMGKFASLEKDDDPFSITRERAVDLILAKRKADAEKFIKVFDENSDIQVINGRYGPYIKAGKKNVKIPKGTDPASLTLEQCLELAAKAPDKKKRRKK
ncbi:MAG: type I DNA topoisomerase [Bacteroidota bacterium]